MKYVAVPPETVRTYTLPVALIFVTLSISVTVMVFLLSITTFKPDHPFIIKWWEDASKVVTLSRTTSGG